MTTRTKPALPVRPLADKFEVEQLGVWLDIYGDQRVWPQDVQRAFAHAVTEHRIEARRQVALSRPAVRELIHILELRAYHPAQGPKAPHLTTCWLSRETAGRYSLIVPALYGPLDFLRLVSAEVVEQALAAGLVEIGPAVLMPPYNYGGPRYRWRTIQQGQPIRLAENGGVR